MQSLGLRGLLLSFVGVAACASEQSASVAPKPHVAPRARPPKKSKPVLVEAAPKIETDTGLDTLPAADDPILQRDVAHRRALFDALGYDGVLNALLGEVDAGEPLRASFSTKPVIELPLDVDALKKGLVVVHADIDGKRSSFLWDETATENVLSLRAADTLHLPCTHPDVDLMKRPNGRSVKLVVAATREINVGAWRISNIPWVVANIEADRNPGEASAAIDGLLAPELLAPEGCHQLDVRRAKLTVGLSTEACSTLSAAVPTRRGASLSLR